LSEVVIIEVAEQGPQGIQGAEGEVGPPGSVQSIPELVMPPFIYGVQGRECNVYFDNLHLADAFEYFHDVTSVSASGKQQQERWTWIPTGAVSTGSLTITANEKHTGTVLVTKTANQRAAASSAGTGLTKKVIVIGDSLVNAGAITQTLLDISAGDAMHVTMHGTQGIAPNQHEGRGGWAISTYVTTGSPFYISGAVNFPQYLTNNSIATPDWVLIHLGINDVFGQTSDTAANNTANNAFLNLDILIASIKAAGASVNVGLMIPTPGSKFEDAFGNNYATGQTGWRFKRNILIWARQLIAKYAGQEANRIYLIPSNTALDTVNNMSVAASAPVNSRSLVSSTRQSNGVHPATQGYQQIADAVWAFLKYHA
jgi:lysophospholipase L1-like esterase